METAAKQLGLSVRWLQKDSLRLKRNIKSEAKPGQQARRLLLAIGPQFPLYKSGLLPSTETTAYKRKLLFGRWDISIALISCLLKHSFTRNYYRYLSLCCFKNKHLSLHIRGKGFYPSEKRCSVADL